MPIYEYVCTKCEYEFELEQSIHDKPRSRCPKCRGKVRKVISGGIGIAFKGSGFYVTDSRSGKAPHKTPDKAPDKTPDVAPASVTKDGD